MHPQIIEHHPGHCPICGMELVPFDKNHQEAYLTLGPEQQALANIHTLVVGKQALGGYTLLNGRLDTDPTATQTVSSRNTGRIERLYVRESGIAVKKGQALYQLYSEELLSLQQELLMTRKQAEQFAGDKRFAALYDAARQKLLLYGQTPEQLKNLIRQNQTAPYITVYSPASGIVAELLIGEGQYVQEGSEVMRLEAYDQLWAIADTYPGEAEHIHVGQSLQVDLPGYDRPVNMQIQFITPVLMDGKQTISIRGTIPNPDKRLQAGMPVQVRLPQAVAEEPLVLPSDAVIREERSSHVWIALPNNRFEPRAVQTGKTNLEQTAILSGLQTGERVVTHGAYLLYSEYKLKKGELGISH